MNEEILINYGGLSKTFIEFTKLTNTLKVTMETEKDQIRDTKCTLILFEMKEFIKNNPGLYDEIINLELRGIVPKGTINNTERIMKM